MAPLSKETIKSLRIILKENYRKDVNFEDATKIANGLVQYFGKLGEIYNREKIKKKDK